MNPPFYTGDRVRKIRGYRFPGYVVACFQALDIPEIDRPFRFEPSSIWRVVVQNSDGLMHIFDPAVLVKVHE